MPEITTATTSVMANCLYIWPLIPPRNATGRNTAQRESTIATSALATWPMARSAATRGGTFSSAMIRSTFSMTTIASSTTMPIASTRANSVSRLIWKPSIRSPKKVPMIATGTASSRDQGGAPALQEDEDHQGHQDHGFEEGLHHLVDRGRDERRGIEGDEPGHPRREAPGQLVHPRDDRRLHVERVRARPQVQPDGGGGNAIDPADQVVALGPERHAADVLDPDQRAIGVGPDDDVRELLRIGEPPEGRDRKGQLVARWRRFPADPAGRVGRVLLLHRRLDIRHREAELGHAVGIEAQQHRELERADGLGVAHPGNALELVRDVNLGVVVQIGRVVPRDPSS